MSALPQPRASAAEFDTVDFADTLVLSPEPELRSFGGDSEAARVDSPARLLQAQLASRIQFGAQDWADAGQVSHGLSVPAKIAIILGLSLVLWTLPIAAYIILSK